MFGTLITLVTMPGLFDEVGWLPSAPVLHAQERPFGTLREQAEIRQEWLRLRLERVLPRLMREHGVDMWIVPSREYNEDPVFQALVSPTTFAARRRTIYVFCDRGRELGVRRVAIGGTDQGGLYGVVREPDAAVNARGRAQEPYGFEQWRLLAPLVNECDPGSIQVNLSYNFAFSVGVNAGEWEQLQVALGPVYRHRVVHRGLLPLQGLWDRQEGVQGMDIVPVRPNTWFSTELQVTTPIPEWDGQPVRSAQEEEAYLDAEGNRHWVLARQAEFHIVR